MEPPRDQQSVDHDINDLRASLDRYAAGGVHPSPELVADLTKGINTIGDHLMAIHRRLERLEENENEWTTRGWEPPPGADRRAWRSH